MTEDEQPEDLIRYDVLTQEALRDVIKKVLEEISVTGLPGEHHFFITFRTDYPGVKLSARMRERYPEEMTIVIQHSFWDLNVNDAGFEIDLSFNDILERLRVPFASLKGFFDPHVKFGVQFDADTLEAANMDDEQDNASGGNTLPEIAQTREVTEHTDKKSKPKKAKKAKSEKTETEEAPASEEGGAEIVSLDNFRKKQ